MKSAASKKPVKARKRWVINPKTRIKKSDKIYFRPKEKKRIRKKLTNEVIRE